MTITDDQARAIAAAVIRLAMPQEASSYDGVGAHHGFGEHCYSAEEMVQRLDAAEITVALQRELTATIESAMQGAVSKPGSESV